jgi:hypothetical protein
MDHSICAFGHAASIRYLLAASTLAVACSAAWGQVTPSGNGAGNGNGNGAGAAKVVQGDVRVSSATGERTLKPGDRITVADRLTTGDGGSASVVLRDGTTLVVGPKSQLQLKDFAFNSTTHEGSVKVSLLQGTLRMITGLIAKLNPASVSVETDTITMGVRGTDFIVEIQDVR